MGTRADFYAGCGPQAEWLGSVAFDGDRWSEGHPLLEVASERAFRFAVTAILGHDKSATVPEQGWPWPWNTSATTDYTYWFADGHVQWAHFDKEHEWPDMSTAVGPWGPPHVTLDPDRSGVLIVPPVPPVPPVPAKKGRKGKQ